ncbi:hypothetical protein TNCV_3496111 [Trichonephila clavipes]|nr:hypothetical protein TNCV_3496111 [Trichonephila clavipes]
MPADPKNLGSVAHDRSYDRVEEQNLVPDRKITPSGDKPFKHGMNSARFSASLFDMVGKTSLQRRFLAQIRNLSTWKDPVSGVGEKDSETVSLNLCNKIL